jgi:hypothetical protein
MMFLDDKSVKVVEPYDIHYDKKVKVVSHLEQHCDMVVKVVDSYDLKYDMKVKLVKPGELNYDLKIRVINPEALPAEYRPALPTRTNNASWSPPSRRGNLSPGGTALVLLGAAIWLFGGCFAGNPRMIGGVESLIAILATGAILFFLGATVGRQ